MYPAMDPDANNFLSPAGAPAEPTFSEREIENLRALRGRYALDGDRFDARQLAYLRFVRWLYQSERIRP